MRLGKNSLLLFSVAQVHPKLYAVDAIGALAYHLRYDAYARTHLHHRHYYDDYPGGWGARRAALDNNSETRHDPLATRPEGFLLFALPTGSEITRGRRGETTTMDHHDVLTGALDA